MATSRPGACFPRRGTCGERSSGRRPARPGGAPAASGAAAGDQRDPQWTRRAASGQRPARPGEDPARRAKPHQPAPSVIRRQGALRTRGRARPEVGSPTVRGRFLVVGRSAKRVRCKRSDGSYEYGESQYGESNHDHPNHDHPNHDYPPERIACRPKRPPPEIRGPGRPFQAGDPTSGRARPRVRSAPWRRITGRAALGPAGPSSTAVLRSALEASLPAASPATEPRRDVPLVRLPPLALPGRIRHAQTFPLGAPDRGGKPADHRQKRRSARAPVSVTNSSEALL
jgi:hypothetical protein